MRGPHLRAVVSAVAMLATVSNAHVLHADDKRRDHGSPDERGGSGSASVLGVSSPYFNALRIARMLHDDRLVARLLTMQGLGGSATEADLRAVISAYEIAGTPELAVDFLRGRIRQHPAERRVRVLLAQLYARGGQSREAVLVWRQYVERFGFAALSFDDGCRYARDLSRAGELDEAYTTLLALRSKAPGDAVEYWTDLATLAWERADEVALAAYENVYRFAPSTLHAGSRLMTLLAEAKRRDEAVRVAIAEYRRTNDAASVLFAGHLLANDGDWRGLWSVIQEAERAPGSLRGRAEYLLLKGDAAKQLGDLQEAESAYRAALAVAPDDPVARASALWTAIERHDSRQVGVYVALFRGGTRDEPALWLPMAHALVSIGRPGEAVDWFSLQLKTTPQDARLMLDLSGALAIVGRDAFADELRRRAVARLQSEITAAVRSPQLTEEDRHLIESTAHALRTHAGVPRADPWMSVLSRSSRSSAPLPTRRGAPGAVRSEDEVAADWYLATGRPEYARRIVAGNSALALRKHRLTLALIDGDPAQMKASLADAGELPPE
ncbi:MAG TPA: tetratricopeptide repeat protein, partial [Labilithrix sp.]|nr:tetratricopeptide repeat protein [Labilithrix sp.]